MVMTIVTVRSKTSADNMFLILLGLPVLLTRLDGNSKLVNMQRPGWSPRLCMYAEQLR